MKTKLFIVILLLLLIYNNQHAKNKLAIPLIPNNPTPVLIHLAPVPLEIDDYTLGYQSYDEIISMVKNWENKTPLLIETGNYGKSSKGKENFYFKVSNENNKPQYIAIITACIHGNEPWSTSTIMAYAGWILSEYGKNERITKILDNTNIYFIPVVSPDTYPFARQVDGLDPNRNFPTPNRPDKISVNPVQNLRDFFLKIKPNSILSGHTYGRVFLVPWGDTREINPNANDYIRIVSKMAELSKYRYMKASELYGSPIVGGECDWFHRNGAFSIVMEFGSHQRKPNENDTENEFQRTKDSFLYFLEESVKVNIKN